MCQAWLAAQAPTHSPDQAGLAAGVVYYAEASGFKPLEKQVATEGGRPTITARVQGAHSAIRLPAGQPSVFRICETDPTRFKLYALRSTKKVRTVVVGKVGTFSGRATTLVSESEIPVSIQSAGHKCFEITPKDTLKNGEYAFSPVDSDDVFAFGVGEVQPVK